MHHDPGAMPTKLFGRCPADTRSGPGNQGTDALEISLASAGCPGCREMTPTCRSGRAHAGGPGRLPGAEHLRGRAVPLEAIMQLVIRDAAALAYGDPPS